MAVVTPVTTFPDEPDAWLEHLARVTRWTVGARCTAAQAVVLGRYDASAEALVVQEVLKGEVGGSAGLLLPRPTGAGAPARFPVPEDGDAVLAFLSERVDADRWPPLDAPGALVPAWAAEGLDATTSAARWFTQLPADSAARADELAAAVRDPDRGGTERTSALRAIGDEGLIAAAPALHEITTSSSVEPQTATLASVALWLLGERGEARQALQGVMRRVGQDQFLALWHVQRTSGDDVAAKQLYGPDSGAWGAP
jgi:hypothetical protein